MIPIAKLVMGQEEAAAAARAIESGWINQGPRVAEFEQAFGAVVGARQAAAVSSGTAGLHLALLALGIGPGDEVVTVSHSFIATANAIRYCGATPVFVDIDPRTFNLDPGLLEAAITARTRAILCVHQVGLPCDLPRILDIAGRNRLPVVEDAACAIGSEIRIGGRWEKIGKPHGDIACFSFHPRKVISTGEGGMVTTNTPELDDRVRLLRQHGMSLPASARHGAGQVAFEGYSVLGFNYRMTDIQAAIGMEQLTRLPDIVARRRAIAGRYRELLAATPGLVLPVEPDWARSNWQSYCVRLPESIDQVRTMQHLLDAGIATRRGVMCAHREAAYPPGTWSCGADPADCRGFAATGRCEKLRLSEEAQDRTLILPLFPQMALAEVDRVAAALVSALESA